MNNRETDRRRSREYRAAHPELVLAAHLRRRYGIDLPEYQRLFDLQDGRCGICERLPADLPKRRHATPDRLVVDHDHRTGAVRGLLCYSCNAGIGMVGAYLSQARIYLESAA